jgi:hypothetical protein
MSQLQVTGEAKIRDIQGPVVANDGVITALDGAASQYVRGDGTLADFPTSSGGGSSVSYYLNSSVSQGTIGGVAYRELSKEPIIGTGTDITISSNGYVASYITDINDPDVISIPGGNFNCEFYFSVNNNTGNPNTYAELYKYDGTTFTLLGSSVGVPESINQGTTIAPYYFAIPVATATLALTDRLAIRIYVNVDGRTVTLHTENGHLCQVVTTLSKGMVSLNNLTDQSQFLATGTSGTNFAIVSSGDTHTFNLPIASASNTGKLSSTDWSTFNGKVPYTGATANVDLGVNFLKARTFYAEGNGGGGSYAIKNGATPSFEDGYTILSSNDYRLNILSTVSSVTKAVYLGFSGVTATRTYTLPDASGTIALTSNLSSYVPYTGATTNVNLGLQYILAGQLTSGYVSGVSGSINPGSVLMYHPANPWSIGIRENSTLIYPDSATSLMFSFFQSTTSSGYNFKFNVAALTLNTLRTYTLPDASGTIALTSQLPTYGNLTSADSGSMTITGGTGAVIGSGTSITLLNASETNAGIVSTGTQTFAGAKTFSLDILVNSVKIGNANGSNLNTVVGFGALTGTGVENTAFGYLTLSNNTTGNSNTAVGKRSLLNNTSASWNTAIGAESLFSNTTGVANVAIGYYSLFANTTGFSNVSVGYNSMTTSNGNENTAIGNQSMQLNTNGVSNTAIGHTALQNNTTGNNNIGIGYESGKSITTGNYNTIIGSYVGTAAMSNNIVLADGQGNIRYQWNGTNNVFTGAATFSSSVSTTELKLNNISALIHVSSYNVLRDTDANNAIILGNSSTPQNFYNNTEHIFRNRTGTTSYLNITSAGNVGIGTTTPSSAGGGYTGLDIRGTTGSSLVLGSTTTLFTYIYASASAFTLETTSSIPILFASAGTERIRITSGGALKVSNNGVYLSNTAPYHEFTQTNTDTNTIIIRNTAASPYGNYIGFSATPNNTTNYFLAVGDSSQDKLIIWSNGSVQNRTGSYGTISDIKFKENIVDATPKLADLMQLKVRNFNMIGDETKQIGFIAQEFEEVFPKMIDISTDKESGEEYKSIKTSVLVPMLVKAIQEQQAQIEELKAKIK